MDMSFWIAITIFTITYAIIVFDKVHFTVISLAGAALMILLGIMNQEQAVEGVDFNTIGLLIGMMIIVSIAKKSGMFQYVAIWASKAGKGNPRNIFILFGILVAAFSAFLDNVTTVLLMVPVVFVITHNLKINPKPFLLETILLSNIGGTATLIGDPPNILVGSAVGLSFNDFIINLAPIIIVITVVTIAILCWIYKKDLVTTPEAQALIMKFEPKKAITNQTLLLKSLFVLGLVMLGFFTHSVTHLEVATIALAGASLLLLITCFEPEKCLNDVEWTSIFFFAGLFILVTGIEKVGAIRIMAEELIKLTGDNQVLTTIAILWGSAMFSAIVNNIPFIATMIPLIKDVGSLTGLDLAPMWWALLIGTDIGGNATIIGASANVIVNGMGEKEGYKFDFIEYMKLAVPLTFIALLIGSVYIYLRYLM